MPLRAASAVEMAMTRGMASPRAWGQAITSTVTVRSTAWSGSPRASQTIRVTSPAPRANQNSSPAARSARAWARDLDAWACSTSRRIPASAVSSPTASTRTRTAESVTTVPATTRSPGSLATGRDSPVSIDSSSSADPSAITPSAGTRPPGRTSTRSPTARSPTGTVSTRSPTTRSAWSGRRAASASRAPEAWPRARISSQWPSSMITIRRDSSHQNSRSNRPRAEAALAPNPTRMASEISSIMPGCLERASDRPPWRNGQPPYRNTTVPSTGATHPDPGNCGGVNPSHSCTISE